MRCPMNYMFDLKLDQFKPGTPTLEMDNFFIKHPLENDRRTCRKVEEFISEYATMLSEYNLRRRTGESFENVPKWQDQSLLLQADFDAMVKNIQKLHLSSNYTGLFSWLIDRAFIITPALQSNAKTKSKVKKNRALLLKTLYTMNKGQFLKCFDKNPE